MGQWMASSELEHPMVCCGVVLSPSPSTTPVTKGKHNIHISTRSVPYLPANAPSPAGENGPPQGPRWGHVARPLLAQGSRDPRAGCLWGCLTEDARSKMLPRTAWGSCGCVASCIFTPMFLGFFFSSHYKLNSSNSLQGEICFSLLCKGTAASFS